MRIALIHALKHSIVPIEASFARLWPDASLMNLLDDSLSADLARDGRLTDAMTERFLSLGRYAASTGADAILFTCSAFGPCIEAVARAHAPMPVLKPNEAMIEQAVAKGRRIGLLSTFAPTLVSMPPEFPGTVEVVPKLAEGALAALDRGDRAGHDRLVVEASRDLRDCDLIALAQYSMAPAAELVAAASGRPVAHHAGQRGREAEAIARRCRVTNSSWPGIAGSVGHAKHARHLVDARKVDGWARRKRALAHDYESIQNKLPCPSSSAAGAGLRGVAFFAGFGASAARSSAVIGRISCASSLATRLTRVETSCQTNSPSAARSSSAITALGAVVAAIEPALEIAGRDRHRHAVMQHRKIGARRCGDDRHGVELLAVRARSRFPPAPPGRSAARRGDG